MIRYEENTNKITQSVEIDLTEIPDQSRQDTESKIIEYLKHIPNEHKKIFKFEPGNRLAYETEVLIPKVNTNRINVLMVVGNPAIHSVADGMPFSHEKARNEGKKEHRFWRALRDLEMLEFDRDVKNPTAENNAYKRDCLLNGRYKSDFNIFLLPYFSFPTPASGKYGGVDGIANIVREDIFAEMKEFEFQRFKGIVLCNEIKNVICFQKTTVLKEILNDRRTKSEQIDTILNNPDYPVYKINDVLKHVTLYYAGPTRRLHIGGARKILEDILSHISKK